MIVKTRKVHTCDCGREIDIGTSCNYEEFRFPRYSDDYEEKQIGIEYYKSWTCPFCEAMFLEEQIKLEAEAKNKGFNSHEEMCDEYEMMCDVWPNRQDNKWYMYHNLLKY